MADSLNLTISDLSVTAPSGRTICAVPRLTLPAGQSLGLRGVSGAGKSTLLFALAGLLDRAKGRIDWGGTDLLSLDAERRAAFRRMHIGLIFQDHHLFDEMGSSANAAVAALFQPRSVRAAIRDRALQGLDRLGLEQSDRNTGTLSGGERQRVGVARALAGNPDVILADEPTASLDREAADALSTDLVSFADGARSLIVVSHDAAILDRMAQVATLRDGRLV